MSDTAFLGLPLIAADQAQKHVTHNEALQILDLAVQLAVKRRDLATPPVSPAEGDRYIVAAGATGAWSGHAQEIAVRRSGAWAFQTPAPGWRAWVEEEEALVAFDGGGWVAAGGAGSELQNLDLLGVGTQADATNPFAAKLNQALWTARTAAEGGDGDLRTLMNKEAAADVLSLLLQRGFTGCAEIGLIGDDDLTIKVSADGASWKEALKVDRTTGKLTHLGQLQFPAVQNPSADANCLDDYEEGTFTPTFTAQTTAPTGVTYSAQVGRYTRIGDVVHYHLAVALTSKGSGGAGNAQLAGLPFTTRAGINPIGNCRLSNVAFSAGYSFVATLLQASATTMIICEQGSGVGDQNIQWSAIANNSVFVVTGLYWV